MESIVQESQGSKAFRIEVINSSSGKPNRGAIVVRARNALELESEIRNELSKWRIKFSNRGIQIATKKAMKTGRGYIADLIDITRVCSQCYGATIDYLTGEVCSACNGTGLPVRDADEL